MRQEELEARITVLEDIEAIKKLKYRYAQCVDAGDWKGLARLATEDAVWDFGELGCFVGTEEIIRCTRDIFMATFTFEAHMFHNPIIEVKGNMAAGQWYFEVPATHKAKNRAVWITGRYDEEYIKIKGEWKFKRVAGSIYFTTPYDEGWVKTRNFQ